jgi:DNA-binding GntR family transcriptional regulator
VKIELSAIKAKRLLATFSDPTKVTLTLSEQIAKRLGEDIIRGIFAPGQPLIEVILAETYFHVSRGPIREALRILENEGLVQIRPRRGAIVAELSATDIKEVFNVRAVLYGFIASELAKKATHEILSTLHNYTKMVTTAFDSNDVDDFITTLYRLSMYLPDALGNIYAKKIIVSVGRQTLANTRKVMMNKENCQIWINNWKHLVTSIEQRNIHEAEDAGRRLVNDVYECIEESLKLHL